MKNIGILILLTILVSSFTLKSCSTVSEDNYQSSVSESEIEFLNKNLIISDDYTIFLPENIRKHKEIYLRLDDILEDNYSLCQLTQEVLNSVEIVKRNHQNYGFHSSPDLWEMTSGDLKRNIKECKTDIKKNYSDDINDSLKSVFKSISEFKEEYSECYKKDLKEILKGRNYRNSPCLNHNMLSDLGLYDIYKLLNKIQANKHYIQNQLFLNKIKHNNYDIYINNQKQDLLAFLKSDKLVFENEVQLFKPMSSLLTQLKHDSKVLRETYKKNEQEYNSKIIDGANKTLDLYINVIAFEIQSIH